MTIRELPETILAFIREHLENRRFVIMVIAGVSAVLLACVCVILVLSVGKNSASDTKTGPKTAESARIRFDDLIMPDEPGVVFKTQLSRERLSRWPESERDKWFTDVSDLMLEQLQNLNNRKVAEIMESVP